MTVKRRNILLITADQWRGECLGILDHPCVRTPALDQLAREGTVFSRHYTQCAPCSPARASLHTGLYQKKHRVLHNGTPLDARHTNLALECRKAGYDPTLFGYTDQTFDPRTRDANDPRMKTYEEVIPGFSVAVQIDTYQKPYNAWLRAKGVDVPDQTYGVYLPRDEADRTGRPNLSPPIFNEEQTEATFISEKFREYVTGQAEANWFAHLSILSPHPPFIVPEPWNTMIDPADTPKPVRAETPDAEGEQHPYLAWELSHRGANHFHLNWEGLMKDFSEEDIAKMRATYFGMMGEIDARMGEIFNWLKSIGQYEDTLIIFTSDHGEMLGDHYGSGKFGYFDEAYRIPLIIKVPGHVAPGGKVDRFTETIDVMPTVLEWLGMDVPANCDGNSLMPFLNGKTPEDWRTEVHWEYDFGDVANPEVEQSFGLSLDECHLAVIRDEKFKYVHFAGMKPLFFDLGKDPDNFINRANDPDYAPLILEYAQKMLSWKMVHDDQTLSAMHASSEGVVERTWNERRGRA